MYALVDENGKIIQKSKGKAGGRARFKIEEEFTWKEFLIPEHLEGNDIKYDPIAGGLVEDVAEKEKKNNRRAKIRAAINTLSAYNENTANLDETKTALKSVIDLLVTPESRVLLVRLLKSRITKRH